MSGRAIAQMLFCFLVTSPWTACVEDATNTGATLEGRWEIVRGFRNQQETGTLAGTYFQFGADGRMMTNLPVGPEESVEYAVSKSVIRQKFTPPVEYTIRSLNDSMLVLSIELRGMQFDLHLQKSVEPVLPKPSEELLPDTGTNISEPGDSEE